MTEPSPPPDLPEQPLAPGWWLASDGRWYPPYPVYAAPPPGRTTNGLAIASLVLSLMWCYWVGSLLAIIFGHIALGQIKRSEGLQQGRGLAIAGVVVGWVSMALAVVAAVLAVVFWDELSALDSDPRDGVCNTERVWEDPDC